MVVAEIGVGVGLDMGEVVVGNSLDETVSVKHFDVCEKHVLFGFVCQIFVVN